jgi:hypothetical protein
LDQSKFGANLNPFEINLIGFENRIGRNVLPTPPVSAAPTTSPHYPALDPATDDRAPIASRPTCQPRRPASCRPRRPPLTRGNAPPHAASRPPLSPSLSPTPPPCGAHPSGPPSPPLPLKPSRRPPAKKFLPHAPFISSIHSRASHAHPHCLGVNLTGFPPPEPLLRAGLCPSITTVRRPPLVSAPLSCSFPQLTAASSPSGLPRTSGPSHPRRRPLERPRRH